MKVTELNCILRCLQTFVYFSSACDYVRLLAALLLLQENFIEICDGEGWYFSSPSNQHPLTGSNFDFESEWGAASAVKDATQINLIFINWEFSQLRPLSVSVFASTKLPNK